jgi:F-type H+-transporting ATPase subunit a
MFDIIVLFSIGKFAFTNFMLSILVTISVFLLIYFYFGKNNLLTLIALSVNDLITDICKQSIGEVKWKYLLIPMFYFISINNIMGCFSFLALNGFMVYPMTLSITIAILALFVGIYKKNIYILLDLTPQEVPNLVKPFIFVIELISTVVKPFTLFIRLFLNIYISHYISSIIHALIAKMKVLGIVALPILIPLNIMEIGTGILQAFIFVNFGAFFIGVLTSKAH